MRSLLTLVSICFFVSCSPINKQNRIKKTFELATQKLNDAYYEDAIVLYSKVLEMDHEVIDAHMNRGVAYYETGHYALALADYNEVRQARPDFDDVLFNRAYTYLAMARYDMALDDLKTLKKQYPDTALVYSIQGYVYGQQENYQRAKESFEKAVLK
ncbi:tetratricopeptide repeat protein, partial [Reichenbachiella sp.]